MVDCRARYRPVGSVSPAGQAPAGRPRRDVRAPRGWAGHHHGVDRRNFVTGKRILIAAAVLLVLGGSAAAVWLRPLDLPEVAVEPIRKRDLDAIVSASGKIQPKRQ